MTRTVIANFPDGEAARRAAVALGRTELAAGPTRVRVDASSGSSHAWLELRVEDSDAPRAISLLREHGARVDEGGDGPDLRSRGPLAGWGMAVADAVTAAMGGATASDQQVPANARDGGRPPASGEDTEDPNGPRAESLLSGLSAVAGGRGPRAAAPADGGRDATRTDARGADGARARRDGGDTSGGGPGAADAMHGPGSQPSMAAPGRQRVTGRPGEGASMISTESRMELPKEFDRPPIAGQASVTGNAPPARPDSQIGTASGTHLSDTAGAGTESSMGQIGAGSSLGAAMGATDATGTASGTRTKADPKTQQRADDIPMHDPRPPQDRQVSDA